MEYWHEGHTLAQTKETFRISVTTIYKWENQLKKEGNLKKHPVRRPFKKIDPEKLKEYVKTNSEAYLYEIAIVFNCSPSAIRNALNRLNITRKKTARYYEQDPQKVKEYLEKIKDVPKEKIVYIDETGIV